jgi:ubiquitin-activating enzyme E1
MEAMTKLIKLRVLIVGCRGLGIETAKNLILTGPASVNIFDPKPA